MVLALAGQKSHHHFFLNFLVGGVKSFAAKRDFKFLSIKMFFFEKVRISLVSVRNFFFRKKSGVTEIFFSTTVPSKIPSKKLGRIFKNDQIRDRSGFLFNRGCVQNAFLTGAGTVQLFSRIEPSGDIKLGLIRWLRCIFLSLEIKNYTGLRPSLASLTKSFTDFWAVKGPSLLLTLILGEFGYLTFC